MHSVSEKRMAFSALAFPPWISRRIGLILGARTRSTADTPMRVRGVLRLRNSYLASFLFLLDKFPFAGADIREPLVKRFSGSTLGLSEFIFF